MEHSQLDNDAIARDRDAFMDRVLQAVGGTFFTFGIYLGDRLGFYRALAKGESLTSGALAQRCGTAERYTREWLEQQTVAGVLEVEDEAAPADQRRYRLPVGRVEVLADADSLNYLTPLARMLAGATRPLDALVEAYRTGRGVPYGAYGVDLIEGQAAINRPMFLEQLGSEWLPAMPDVHARLQAQPAARVADVGCGAGWSSIGIAQAYPHVLVDGFDLDTPSIELARDNARDAGLSERLLFHVRDAADPSLAGTYDLVLAIECLHDMSDPVGALRTMRGLVRADGSVLVVDERVAPSFTAKGNEVEWMMYGWSILHCLPVGMADQPSAATGTVMRPLTLAAYAERAGFSRVEILPIDNFFFSFYRLHQ